MAAKGFDVAELLNVLVDIARTGARSHITSEFHRCANSSAGSRDGAWGIHDDWGFSPRPTPLPSPTAPSTPATGPSVSVLHTEDSWWTYQNADQRYLAEMEAQHRDDDFIDNTDPKSWK